jgi:hypothetical protein
MEPADSMVKLLLLFCPQGEGYRLQMHILSVLQVIRRQNPKIVDELIG